MTYEVPLTTLLGSMVKVRLSTEFYNSDYPRKYDSHDSDPFTTNLEYTHASSCPFFSSFTKHFSILTICIKTHLWGNATPPATRLESDPTSANSLPVSWVCSQPTTNNFSRVFGFSQIQKQKLRVSRWPYTKDRDPAAIPPAIPARVTATI